MRCLHYILTKTNSDTKGSSVAFLLKDKAHINIYDNDPLRRIKAKYMGYNICSLKQGIKRAQIVIGCSGNTWAMENELIKLNDDVSIVCATSERVEYSHEFLDKNSSSHLNVSGG
ncbi:MAG TPA: hypothetical protein VJ583_09330 [Nitrososphaeraceae archaeon]|nr:hypothetical protein [Nitrososphaeraceae archaeon]